MHAVLSGSGGYRPQHVPGHDQIRVGAADATGALLGNPAGAHVADPAADSRQSEIALGLLLIKTVEGIVNAQLLHPQKHFPYSGIRSFLDDILLGGKSSPVGLYRFHVIRDIVGIVMMGMLNHVFPDIRMPVNFITHMIPPFVHFLHITCF